MKYHLYHFDNSKSLHAILDKEHISPEDNERHKFLKMQCEFLDNHLIFFYPDFIDAIEKNIKEYKRDRKAIKRLILNFKEHDKESMSRLNWLTKRKIDKANKSCLNIVLIRLIIEFRQFFISFCETYLSKENIDRPSIENLLNIFINLTNLIEHNRQIAMINAQTYMIAQRQQQQPPPPPLPPLPPPPQQQQPPPPPPQQQQQTQFDTIQKNTGNTNGFNITEIGDDLPFPSDNGIESQQQQQQHMQFNDFLDDEDTSYLNPDNSDGWQYEYQFQY